MFISLLLACSILQVGPIQQKSNVVEFEIQSEKKDQSYLVVDTPLYAGQFDVNIQRSEDLGTVTVSLVGFISYGQDTKQTVDAELHFTYPFDQNTVERVGNGRLVRGDRGVELFKAEKLAPVSFEWSSVKHPEFGYIQIWDVDDPDTRIADSILISLYHDMVALDGEIDIQGSECDPNFIECLNAAKKTCGVSRIGSFSYSCTNKEVVSCSFTCVQSAPS